MWSLCTKKKCDQYTIDRSKTPRETIFAGSRLDFRRYGLFTAHWASRWLRHRSHTRTGLFELGKGSFVPAQVSQKDLSTTKSNIQGSKTNRQTNSVTYFRQWCFRLSLTEFFSCIGNSLWHLRPSSMSMIVGRLSLGIRLHAWWRSPVSRPNHEWLFLVLGISSAVRSAVESFPSCKNCIPKTRTVERREDSINWFTCLIKFNSWTSNWSRETFSFSPVRACWRRWCISFSTRRSVSIDVSRQSSDG